MSSDNQKTSNPSFMTGLFWGLVIGFVLALFIHRNNPKLFKQLSKQLHQFLKDISFPDNSPKPPLPSSPTPSRRRSPSVRRPKTFTRSKK